VEEVRRKPYDLLDAGQNHFDRDFLEFNVHINELELAVQARAHACARVFLPCMHACCRVLPCFQKRVLHQPVKGVHYTAALLSFSGKELLTRATT
jgi:dynein heavy chain